MNFNALVFWMNIPSLHQADMVKSLANLWQGPVTVATEYKLYEKRIKQGWNIPDFGNAELKIAPSSAERLAIVDQSNDESSIHIFCGLTAYPENYKILKMISGSPAKIGLLSEAAKSLGGLRTLANHANYSRHAWRWRKRLDFILGTGKTAVDWYSKVGFRKSTIFEFGYFLDSFSDVRLAEEQPAPQVPRKFRIIYVGRHSKMKGVDLLVKSLVSISQLEWQAVFVGDGPDWKSNQAIAQRGGIGERIRWVKSLPRADVLDEMEGADLLVLPSRCDGWGAVVGEALSRGTRVIASSTSGASVLVSGSNSRGGVFPSGSIPALGSMIAESIARGTISLTERNALIEWSKASISPEVAANYFVRLMNHVRIHDPQPKPPWR